jgi:hypothetical protein
VASSRICCRHVSWLSWSGIESDALARLLIVVSEATIEATSPGAMTCPLEGGTVVLVPPPWAFPPLDSDVLVEVVTGTGLDASGLEQAASSSERAATAAATPLPQGRLEELRRVLDISTKIRS